MNISLHNNENSAPLKLTEVGKKEKKYNEPISGKWDFSDGRKN